MAADAEFLFLFCIKLISVYIYIFYLLRVIIISYCCIHTLHHMLQLEVWKKQLG